MKGKWFLLAMLFPIVSFTQQNPSVYRFQTTVSGGVLAGESIAKPFIQASAGFSRQHWVVGAGTGLDLYSFKSIPVFADCRFGIGKKNRAFVYLQPGYNFPFKNKTVPEYARLKDRFTGGTWVEGGLGYRFISTRMHRLSFS